MLTAVLWDAESFPWWLLCMGAAWSHLRCYGSELVVAEQVEFAAVRVAAEVQGFIPVDGEAQNAQEEHPDRSEEQGVELAYHRRRPELEHIQRGVVIHSAE